MAANDTESPSAEQGEDREPEHHNGRSVAEAAHPSALRDGNGADEDLLHSGHGPDAKAIFGSPRSERAHPNPSTAQPPASGSARSTAAPAPDSTRAPVASYDALDIAELSRLVARHRERYGLSLRVAAAQADVPFNTLARVERGHLPDLANFSRIVNWLGVTPDRFFSPRRIRIETTPEAIADQLSRDPMLSPAAAEHIAGLVQQLYVNLATPTDSVRVHLRAAATFTPDAAAALATLLHDVQRALDLVRATNTPNAASARHPHSPRQP